MDMLTPTAEGWC